MKNAVTKKDLERRIFEIENQLPHKEHFMAQELKYFSTERLMGSGVIMTLQLLGSNNRLTSCLIKDGLSETTIEAIRQDLIRSFELKTVFKP